MDQFFNTSRKIILVKDMSSILDFNLINNEFNGLTFSPNTYNDISDEKYLFNRDIFKDTKKAIEIECENFLKNGHGCFDFENLTITNSWGNITQPKDAHHEHTHPFSVVSGVIYLDDNPENLNLKLDMYVAEIPHFIPKMTPQVALKDLIGTENNLHQHMVLFLSNTGHSVNQTDSKSMPRRSIAFNTFWKGITGVKGADLGNHVF